MYQQSYWAPPVQNQWQPQYMPPQNTVNKPSIPGRIVNSISEVTPNEVPMDGSVGVFITKDMSEVYTKAWNSDGTIQTIRYVPNTIPDEPKQDLTEMILARLDTIEDLINKKQSVPNKTSNKEVKQGG